MTFELVPLGDIATVNPRKKALDSSQTCSFVPMDAVDDVTGRLAYTVTKQIAEVQQGYTAFAENDVLFAKITPCMENGKAAIARQLKHGIGFGSTEFHVLRASEETIPEWIFYFLRKKSTRELAEQFMTGSAGQRRVPASFLSEVAIPKPDLKVQKVLVQRLEQADRLRRLRQHTLTISDQYLQSVFLEMFGDPETNPKGWDREELGELMSVPPQIGTTQPAGTKGKQRCVRVGEIGGYYVDLKACGFVSLDEKNLRKYHLEQEDLLLARAIGSLDHLGKMSIVHDTRDDLVYDSHVMRLRLNPKRLLPRFLMTMLITPGGRNLFLKQARRTAVQFNVNAEQMKALPVIVPALPQQHAFVQIVRKHERLRRMQVEALRQAEHLYETLLEEAFGNQS